MLKRMRDSLKKLGYDLDVAGSVEEEVQQKRERAEERSRAGVEIKARDPKHEQYFSQYEQVVNDAFERRLRPQQMRDSFFMCAMSKAGNFSVPGSGKTASVLGVYAYLEAKGLASRIIVICPKNAFESWRNEFIACFGHKEQLRDFSVQAKGFSNLPRSERKRLMRVDTAGRNLILVNYEAAPTYVDELKSLVSSGSLLVFDEVHRVKRLGGKLAKAALEVASVSERTIALTGTPIPNSYLDIYNFLHILFPREYDAFFNFSTKMLSHPSDAEINTINAKIQPFFCRTTKDDLGVPPANEDSIVRIEVEPDTEKVLDVLKMRYRKNKLALMLRVMQLESDAKLLLENLDTREYAWLLSEDEETGEIDYVDYSDEIVGMIKALPPSQKANTCADIIATLATQGKKVIVWCVFVSSIQYLQGRLSSMGYVVRSVYGETPQEVREKRGLSYDIASRMQFFRDAGMFVVAAGVDSAKADKTVEVVDRELAKLCERGVSAAELARTKEFLVGNFRLSHEKVTSKLFFYGATMMSYGRLVMPSEQVDGIKAVTREDVQSVARAILGKGARCLSRVVPK